MPRKVVPGGDEQAQLLDSPATTIHEHLDINSCAGRFRVTHWRRLRIAITGTSSTSVLGQVVATCYIHLHQNASNNQVAIIADPNTVIPHATSESPSLVFNSLIRSLPNGVDDLVFALDDHRWLRDLSPEEVALEEVGRHHRQLVGDELLRRDGEHLCRDC